LVEIMIALAVVAIGLIAIVGLIPQGVQSAHDAADNTIASTIVQDTFNQLRLFASAPSTSWSPTPTWPATLYPADSYYDVNGTNINTTMPTAATYYDVHLVMQSTSNPVTVVAMVMWPVKTGVTAPLNTNTFFTVIGNYQH
jgi:uncharacterized protein (TIGR02598 family)